MKKEANTEFNELLQEIEDSIHAKIGKRRIRVLVFGPDMTSVKSGAKLRRYIINKCKKEEYTAVIAEHKEIVQLYEKIFGPANDLCNMEYHLARDIVDGVVIIPDSEGSFIELGMFTLNEKLHDKILILFNDKYQPRMSSNFVGLGAKAAYDNGHARIRILDYEKRIDAWHEVSGFLDYRKYKKYWEKVKK